MRAETKNMGNELNQFKPAKEPFYFLNPIFVTNDLLLFFISFYYRHVTK